MKRAVLFAAMAFLLVGCLCGCSKEAEESEPEPTAAAEQTPQAVSETITPVETDTPTPAPTEEPEEVVEDINPLTGEPAEENMLARRPFLVMINNISVAQPQVGVSQADMIWELMDEGGITRCMAFFTDMGNVPKVGSIRSARWYNVSVTQAFDGIFVHAGGSDEALGYIDVDGIDDVDFVRGRYSGSTFYRDPDRQAHGIEHSLFAAGADLVQSAVDMGYPLEHTEGFDGTFGLQFSEDAAAQCTDEASSIHIAYAGGKTTDFTYDPETELYTAEQYGSTYTDNGEEPVLFRNVLILHADTSLQSDGLHLSIVLEGSNDGYFCCGGKYIPIVWERDGYTDSFHFYTEDGKPLSLGVGKTFVAVQQTGGYTGQTDFYA